jgi:hypothetical protein
MFRRGTAVIPIEVIPRCVRVKKRSRKRDADNRHLRYRSARLNESLTLVNAGDACQRAKIARSHV